MTETVTKKLMLFFPKCECEKPMIKVTEGGRRPILTPCSLPNFTYQIDPYSGCGHLCRYCYVLAQAETDWSREIRIHGDIGGQLTEEMFTLSEHKGKIIWFSVYASW